MFVMTQVGCGIAGIASLITFYVFSHHWYMHHYLYKIIISILMFFIEWMFFDQIYLELSNHYSTYKIVGILVLIFAIMASNITYIRHRYEYYSNDATDSFNPKSLNFLGHVEFIKSLIINYVICIELLPLIRVTYWFFSSKGNKLAALFQSMILFAVSLIITYVIYHICKLIVIYYMNPNKNMSKLKKYVLQIIHGNFKNLRFYTFKSILLMFIVFILFIFASCFFPSNRLYREVYNEDYPIKLQSQYPIYVNGKKKHTIYTHIYFNKNSNYDLYVKGSSLKFKLKNHKYKRAIDNINWITFNLYRFSNKTYYFKSYSPIIIGHNPINIQLIVYHNK